MKRIFGLRRDEVVGKSGEAYIPRNTTIRITHRVTITRNMRWGKHVARMGKGKLYAGFQR